MDTPVGDSRPPDYSGPEYAPPDYWGPEEDDEPKRGYRDRDPGIDDDDDDDDFDTQARLQGQAALVMFLTPA